MENFKHQGGSLKRTVNMYVTQGYSYKKTRKIHAYQIHGLGTLIYMSVSYTHLTLPTIYSV